MPIAEAVFDVPSILATHFPGFFLFEYANEIARTLLQLREMRLI
jgi:hypothetical protein